MLLAALSEPSSHPFNDGISALVANYLQGPYL